MNAEIFAWEYNPESEEYTIPIDTNLQTMDDYKQAADDIQDRGKYLYQLNVDEKFMSAFKSDKLF